MKKTELLSPAGNFDCLVAAVQNGADSVYFGSSSFNARAFAGNFEGENLEKAIDYAKLRGVKTHLTLNTLIKENEFDAALELAATAYSYGIDAIIVQDLGLASFLIKNFPDLPIHASTQMTIHSLEGAIAAKELGFKRIVLSRELSLDEIKYICDKANVEVETFIHGALCISYSGQCLFSSMIGARSGNRGKCAQACRLPYELLEGSKTLDKGYLLSPRDVCGLSFVPNLMEAGVDCFKIEGRMKSPEYVATVTRIYRKYMDKVLNSEEYSIDEKDYKDLMQVFNRGGFSEGHLSGKPNRNLVYKHKSNNMGIYLGEVYSFKPNKGHISLTLEDTVSRGDTISISSEEGSYTISELMQKNKNLESADAGQIVTIGRMKGNIKEGAKVYKLASKELSNAAKLTFSGSEIKKIPLHAKLTAKRNMPVSLRIENVCETLDILPDEAKSTPITAERLKAQLQKTGNTPYEFSEIDVDLDDGLFLPVSVLNDLRRKALDKYAAIYRREYKRCLNIVPHLGGHKTRPYVRKTGGKKISVLLNKIEPDFDYSSLQNVDRFYVPVALLSKELCEKCNVYAYLPNVVRGSLDELIEKACKFNIKGFVVSHIGQIEKVRKYGLDIVGNYTLNVFNSGSVFALQEMGVSCYTVAAELDKAAIDDLLKTGDISSEMIVYGRLPLMTSHYCLLGKSNMCHKECTGKCKDVYLKDRMGFMFPVRPNNNGTVTTIYNSKVTSIATSGFDTDFVRIDFLDEDVDEMQRIIDVVDNGGRMEGKDFTNGNLNREI